MSLCCVVYCGVDRTLAQLAQFVEISHKSSSGHGFELSLLSHVNGDEYLNYTILQETIIILWTVFKYFSPQFEDFCWPFTNVGHKVLKRLMHVRVTLPFTFQCIGPNLLKRVVH